MNIKNTNNSKLSTYFSNYLQAKATNKINLTSHNLTNLEISQLYDKTYNLTEFDIYKYINAYDTLNKSLNCNPITLTEGITSNKNKYNNILIDLLYMSIHSQLISISPISVVFSIKQEGGEIKDLTRSDFNYLKNIRKYVNYGDLSPINNILFEMKIYKEFYNNYAGDSYTYYIFKQLIKILLSEVYLYKYQGQIFNNKELISYYSHKTHNHPQPYQLRPISNLIEIGEIKKTKYQCIKVIEPQDINYSPISQLKIQLIEPELKPNQTFENVHNTLIEKSFGSFWDFNTAFQNQTLLKNIKHNKKFN